MSKQVAQILKDVLEKINPSEQELKFIDDKLKDFLVKIKHKIKTLKINTEFFVGGSSAKKTLIKKDIYDIDIFLRFDKKYKDVELSLHTKRILEDFDFKIVHGSRDYFQISAGQNLIFEIVPVRKVSKPDQAVNITDLSYSHVKYISNKIKNKKILDDIKIAKAFCHAQDCYGAESYISGFSGYCLELLVYHYKGFLNFIKAMAKLKNEKLIIDIEKHYKNKNEILMDINTAKLQSPIILVDPTFKQRNVAAAIDSKVFEKFQASCRQFLKSPSAMLFERQKLDLEKIKKDAVKRKYEFILLEAKTEKQSGDVAGSKLKKFYNHMPLEISKYFNLKSQGFNYNQSQSARFFFVVQPKKEIILQGPSIKDKKNAEAFKKKHKTASVKSGKLYAKKRVNFTLKDFIKNWASDNKFKIKDMSIVSFRIV